MDEAVFPISCGPKHLTRYLRDMSSLILVLEDSYTHTPIGRCSVDIRFMDVGHPVSGTFPVLMPHDSGGKTGAMSADSRLESTGYALRHVGTIDVHMEIGYHAASNMSSFEINEHLAAQEWRSPRSERQHVGNPEPGSSVSLSHAELRNQPNPLANGGGMLASTELHEASDVSRFDQALDQLDLFELLLNRLQRDFARFCDIFDAWKRSTSEHHIVGLMKHLQVQRIFQRDVTEEQMRYLEFMTDPKGNLVFSIDEVLMAFRQSLEAGVRVRTGQLGDVATILVPLAISLQQGLMLLRQAFRASIAQGGRQQGFMTLQQLVSVLKGILPPVQSLQLRYLVCIVSHQALARGTPGLITFQDVQAFLRISSAWSVQGPAYSRVDSAPSSPTAVEAAAVRPALSDAAAARKLALDRLKHRLKGQRGAGKGQSAPDALQGQSARPPTRPLLQTYAPHVPQFMELRPQLPTAQALPSPTEPAPEKDKGGSSALEDLVRKAEALRKSLGEVSSGSASFLQGGGLNPKPSSPGGRSSGLSLLQFITDAEVTRDLVRETLASQALSRGGGGSPDSRPRDDGGFTSEYDSDGSLEGEEEGGTGGRGRGGQAWYVGDEDEVEEEDEMEAAAWYEQQLLGQLFFPTDGQAEQEAWHDSADINSGPSRKVLEKESPSKGSSSGRQQQQQPQEESAEDRTGGLAALPSPRLHIEVLDVRVPTSHADLSIVVKSPLLSSSSQRQHWTLKTDPPSDDGDAGSSPLLANLSLPARADPPLPSPLIIELWDDRRRLLVGVAQLALSSPDAEPATLRSWGSTSKILALCSGTASLRNPLLSAREEEDLIANCSLTVAARIELHMHADPEDEAEQASTPTLEGGDAAGEAAAGSDDGPPMVRHTFRVTVCGARGMPDVATLSEQGRPVPQARFLRYIYPGDAEPLFTEDVPCSRDPIFAASAAHSILLEPEADMELKLVEATGGDHHAQLLLEVWDRWADGSSDPTLSGTATISLTSLAELAQRQLRASSPTVGRTLALPLRGPGSSAEATRLERGVRMDDGDEDAHREGAFDDEDGDVDHAWPLLEVQLQYEAVYLPGSLPQAGASEGPPLADPPSDPPSDLNDLADAAVTGRSADGISATLSVTIAQACGLQAAVLEAQACMGSSGALLGRSHLVGPNPYATINLIPGGAARGRVPRLQTPYQAQSFCPRFDWTSEIPIVLDAAAVDALATQHVCLEVWHHTSRSLAVALSAGTTGQEDLGKSPSKALVQDVLLGCASLPLSPVLLKPQGISSLWALLKSQRGEPVGAVQVSIRLVEVRGVDLDPCPGSPPPLVTHPGLIALLPEATAQLLAGQAPWLMSRLGPAAATTASSSASSPVRQADASPTARRQGGGAAAAPGGGCGLPSGFESQWSRLTLHVDQLVIPSPGAAAEIRPKAFKYYVTYTLPGSDVEVQTASQSAKMSQQQSGASAQPSPSPISALPGSSTAPATWHVALQHCGVHWVQASEALAAALDREPLRLRVFKAHTRRGAAAGGGGSSHAWVSSSLCGEALVDMSSLMTTSGVRKHQPNTRWLSGSFSVIDPAAKMFNNSRVSVRALLELMPTTLPPTSWLSKSSWQPAAAPYPIPAPDAPADLETSGPARSCPSSPQAAKTQELPLADASNEPGALTDDADSSTHAESAESRDISFDGGRLGAPASPDRNPSPSAPWPDPAGREQSPLVDQTRASQSGPDPVSPASQSTTIRPCASSTEEKSPASEAPLQAAQGGPSDPSIGRPPPSSAPRFPALIGLGGEGSDDDFMFSFKKISPPDAAAFYMPHKQQQHQPSVSDPAPAAAEPSPPVDDITQGSANEAAFEREALRHQLQELELLSLGWRSRLVSASQDGSPSLTDDDADPSGSTGHGADPGGCTGLVGEPGGSTFPDVQAGVDWESVKDVGHLEVGFPPSDAPPCSTSPPRCLRPAPYIEATCSEDGDATFVLGGDSGSETDDTDELIARKSPYKALPPAGHGAHPAAASGTQAYRASRAASKSCDKATGVSSSITTVVTSRPLALPPGGPHGSDEDWMFGFSVTGRSLLSPCNAPSPSDSQRALGRSLVPARATVHPAMAPHLEVTSSDAISIPNDDPLKDSHRALRPPYVVLSEASSVVRMGSEQQAAAHHVRPDTDGEEDAALVQRVQYGGPDARPSTTGFRISNALPALQPDFKLTFSR